MRQSLLLLLLLTVFAGPQARAQQPFDPEVTPWELTEEEAAMLPDDDMPTAADPVKESVGSTAARPQGDVRAAGAKLEVDYLVAKNQAVGFEARHERYDRHDSRAWDQSGEDETAAEMKYRLAF